ncbi:MAG: phage tail tape measure protein [Peptostreptococcaceae bacterium]
MAYDLSAIKMNVNLGDTKKVIEQYNSLVKTLETKHVKLEIDVSALQASVGLATKEIEKAYAKVAEETSKTNKAMKFDYKNSIIDNSSIDKFRQSLSQVRSDIKEISNIKVTYGKNDAGTGLGRIDSAVITHTNNMGKLVTETMAYADTVDKTTGEQVKRWQTISVVVNDNRKALEQLGKSTQKVKDTMGDKMSKAVIGNEWVKDLPSYKQLQGLVNGFNPSNMKQASNEAYNITQAFKAMQQEISKVKLGDKMAGDIDKAQKQLDSFVSSMNQKMTTITIGKDGDWATKISQFQQLQTEMSKLVSMQANGSNLSDIATQIEKVNGLYQQTANEITRVNQLNTEMNNRNAFGQDVANKIADYNRKLDEMISKNAQLSSNPAIQKLRDDINRLNQTPPTEFNNGCKQIDESLKRVQSTMATTTKTGTGLFASLGNSIKSAFSFMSGSMLIYGLATEIRQLPKLVQDVDKSLVELNKVANLSSESLEQFTNQAYKTGDALGRTGREVTDATTEMIKAGYEMADATELAKSAMLSMNVGSGMNDLELATNSLIATIKGFEFEAEQSNDIVNKMAKVADTTAIGYSELADGIQRVSAVMNQGDTSFEETLGLLTSTYELSRNIEKSATGINTISQRMRGLKLSNNGELEKDEELLGKVEDKLRTIAGVELMDNNGMLRSTFDVLQDLSLVWESLNVNQQQFLTETLAGNRQNIVLSQILQNWKTVDKAILATSESTGYSQEVNERYLDSVSGRLASLKSSWEQLAINSLSSDFLKDVISMTNGVVKLIDACGGLQQVLLGVVASFIALKTASFFLAGGDIVAGISATIKSLFTLKTVTDVATGSTLALSAAQKTLGAGIIIAGIMAAGYAINYMATESERANEKVVQLRDELNKLNSNTSTVADLSQQYDELKRLKEAQGLNNEQQKQFYDIQDKLKQLMPQINGYYDDQGRWIVATSESMETLIEKQKESIDLMKQQYAEASKESFEANTTRYDSQTKKLEELIRFKELEEKMLNGTITYKEKGERTDLMSMYYMEFKRLDEAIQDMKNTSNSTFETLKQDLLNVVYVTDEWKNATDSQKDAFAKMIGELTTVEDVSHYFDNMDTVTKPLIDGLGLATESAQKFSDGTIGIADYMSN